jgi:hypothetical protein
MKKNVIISEDQLEDLLKGLLSVYSGDLSDKLVDKNLLNVDSTEQPKTKSQTGSLVDDKFKEITRTIIDNIEGGYYHPNFKVTGAKNTSGKNISPSKFVGMGKSGETMFGIDRKHGGTINTSNKGNEFWSLIDNEQKKGTWPYNYKGGSLKERLVSLVSEMMKEQYKKNAENFLSKEARNIVENDPMLLFNFAYASWNGPGYFKKFAKKVNNEVAMGETKPEYLDNMVYAMRTIKPEKIRDASQMIA